MFKIDDGSVLEHPGVCNICGSQPTKGEFAIDTEVSFTDPAARHLRAHKYVCQKCVEELAALAPNKQVDKWKAEASKWKAAYGSLSAALDGLTSKVVRVSD